MILWCLLDAASSAGSIIDGVLSAVKVWGLIIITCDRSKLLDPACRCNVRLPDPMNFMGAEPHFVAPPGGLGSQSKGDTKIGEALLAAQVKQISLGGKRL